MSSEAVELAARGALPAHFSPPAMPVPLVDAFTRNRPQRAADGDGAPIPAGGRDQYLASLGGSMRRRGMTQVEIEAALKVVNAQRCEPPLDVRDVERIAWSVGRYAADDDLLARLAKGQAELEGTDVREPDAALWERAGFGWLDVTRALTEDPPPYEWLWEGLVERRELVLFSGAGKTGKSMLAMFLGCAALNGRATFLGVPVGAIENLVYLDAENPEKTVRRRLHLAGVPVSLAPRIRYGVLRGADLGSDVGLEALERAVRDVPGALLVLDSMIGLHTADEDSSGEVRRLMNGIRGVAEAYDLTVIGLVHESRAGKTRGSTDWENAVDGTLRVSIKGTGGTGGEKWREVGPENRRDGGDGGNLTRLYRFKVEDDEHGRRRMQMVTSEGVERAGAAATAAEPRPDEPDREAGAVDDLTAGIERVIAGEPAVTVRRLAAHLGTTHGARPFKRALELAAQRSPAVAAWRDARTADTNGGQA